MTGRSPRLVLILVIALTLFVGGVRTIGLDFLLPHQHEPDPYCVFQAEYLLEHGSEGGFEALPPSLGENGRLFYYYPLFLARLWLLGGQPTVAEGRLDDSTWQAHLDAAKEPMLRGRLWSAWISALIVPGVFLLARRFLGPWSSLLAGAFAGTSLLHLISAGQAKPHAIATSAIAFALWGATLMRRRPSPLWLLAGGALFGLGVCSMHYGTVVALAGVAAFFLRDRDQQRGGFLAWSIPIAVLAALYVLSSPGFLIPPPEESQQSYKGFKFEDGVFLGLGHRIDLSLFSLGSPLRPLEWFWWNDPALMVLAILGTLAALGSYRAASPEQRRDAGVLIAHAVPYALILVVYTRTWDRYALPLIPILSVLAATAVTFVASRARPFALKAALVTSALALPMLAQAKLIALRAGPDTYEQATQWLRENVPSDERVATGLGVILTERVHPDDLEQVYSTWKRNPWYAYQHDLPQEQAALEGQRVFAIPLIDPQVAGQLKTPASARKYVRELGARYVVLENSSRSRALKTKGVRTFNQLRRALAAEGRLIQQFYPRDGDAADQVHFRPYGDQPHQLERVLSQDHQGPPVEIWLVE